MDRYYFPVFNEDITKKSVIELSDWILKCRELIKEEDFNTQEQYYEVLEKYFLEWQEHYNFFEEVDIETGKKRKNPYKNEKYKKAIIFCKLRNRLKFNVSYGKGSEDTDFNTYKNLSNIVFIEAIEKEILTISQDYHEQLSKLKIKVIIKIYFKVLF